MIKEELFDTDNDNYEIKNNIVNDLLNQVLNMNKFKSDDSIKVNMENVDYPYSEIKDDLELEFEDINFDLENEEDESNTDNNTLDNMDNVDSDLEVQVSSSSLSRYMFKIMNPNLSSEELDSIFNQKNVLSQES